MEFSKHQLLAIYERMKGQRTVDGAHDPQAGIRGENVWLYIYDP